MKFWKLASTVTALVLSTSTNAALVERLGGLAYYDTEANLTWLADANAGAGSVFDDENIYTTSTDGLMSWQSANDWAASLNIGDITGWRLPTTLQPDPTCSIQNSIESYGLNCSGSEMGNLFHNVLGNISGLPGMPGPFSNIQSDPFYYWTATEHISNTDLAWRFDPGFGLQYYSDKTDDYYAWAVHDGDVAALSSVPLPAAVWLFGSGLVGLIGLARRKKA